MVVKEKVVDVFACRINYKVEKSWVCHKYSNIRECSHFSADEINYCLVNAGTNYGISESREEDHNLLNKVPYNSPKSMVVYTTRRYRKL